MNYKIKMIKGRNNKFFEVSIGNFVAFTVILIYYMLIPSIVLIFTSKKIIISARLYLQMYIACNKNAKALQIINITLITEDFDWIPCRTRDFL